MNPRVIEYLHACEAKKAEQDRAYRENVLRRAGLVEQAEAECSEEEYYAVPQHCRVREEKLEDGWHFVILKDVPIDVTDEEFAAIEKTQAPEDQEVDVMPEQHSGSATFFRVLAWILWIGGLISAIIAANQQVPHVSTNYYGSVRTTYTNEFSATTFISTFSIFAISGAFCMAASELFKKLQTIVNLLREKH